MENAKRMSEAMFFDPSVDWSRFDPLHLLVLRACAPRNVFTREAKAGYLTRVGGNEDLTEITNAIFADDYTFVNAIPELRAILVPLMQVAYEYGIRPAEPRLTLKSRT